MKMKKATSLTAAYDTALSPNVWAVRDARTMWIVNVFPTQALAEDFMKKLNKQ